MGLTADITFIMLVSNQHPGMVW